MTISELSNSARPSRTLPQIKRDLNRAIFKKNIEKFEIELNNFMDYALCHNINEYPAYLANNNEYPAYPTNNNEYLAHPAINNEYPTYLATINSTLDTLLQPTTNYPATYHPSYHDMLISLLFRNPLGITTKLALKMAIKHKNAEKFEFLLTNYHQNIDEPLDKENNTALHCVTMNLKREKLKTKDPISEKMANLLLTKGANPNAQNTLGKTPLSYAVLNNHLKIVQPLLQYNASPYIPDHLGNTPLRVAQLNSKLLSTNKHTFYSTNDNNKIITCLKSVKPQAPSVSKFSCTKDNNNITICLESAKPQAPSVSKFSCTKDNNNITICLEPVKPQAPSVSKFSWLNIFKFWNFFSITSNKNETPPTHEVQHDIPAQNEESSIPAAKFLFDMICSLLPTLSFDQPTTEAPVEANIVGDVSDSVATGTV